jgi:hypothetical protein
VLPASEEAWISIAMIRRLAGGTETTSEQAGPVHTASQINRLSYSYLLPQLRDLLLFADKRSIVFFHRDLCIAGIKIFMVI